jgi:SAM-dependent methyltransferase
MLESSVCKFTDFQSDWFRHWEPLVGGAPVEPQTYMPIPGPVVSGYTVFPPRYHRKPWEFAAITQVLHERDLLKPGKRGLGFAVGLEPLPSIFASLGTEVVASDAPQTLSSSQGWNQTGQFAASRDQLFKNELVSREQFDRLVSFEPLDMTEKFPSRLGLFDFIWSSCALEHLGSLQHGANFVALSSRLLNPGGVAVHTTEYNVASNRNTLTSGGNVVYRRCDIEDIDRALRYEERYIESLNFDSGTHAYDLHYDRPPYYTDPTRQHIKLLLDGHIVTSILLIIRGK